MTGSITGTNVDDLTEGGNSGDAGIITAGSRGSIWDDED